MRVVGLDLSLTSSGVAPSDGVPYRIKTTAKQSLTTRLRTIADGVAFEDDGDTLFIIEEVPSHAAFKITGLAKVHGAVLYVLDKAPYIYMTPPVVKKYATGKGNANKDAVIADAIRRFGFQGSSNDEADAFIMMHMGLELLGQTRIPVPQSHKDKGWTSAKEALDALIVGGLI